MGKSAAAAAAFTLTLIIKCRKMNQITAEIPKILSLYQSVSQPVSQSVRSHDCVFNKINFHDHLAPSSEEQRLWGGGEVSYLQMESQS